MRRPYAAVGTYVVADSVLSQHYVPLRAAFEWERVSDG